MTLDEHALELERRLTLAQKERAFSIVGAAGWRGQTPPAWLWIMVYQQIIAEDEADRGRHQVAAALTANGESP